MCKNPDMADKKRIHFGILCILSSNKILIRCLLTSFICFILISLSITRSVPSLNNYILNLINPPEKLVPFYPLNNSVEIARVASIKFSPEKVYHVNGVAYDRYSISELGQPNVARQWFTFPLPDEINRRDSPSPWYPSKHRIQFPIDQSPRTISDLAYLEQIYVITDESFRARHEQLKKMFHRHSIPIESISYQFKWNRTTCQMKENLQEIKAKLNPTNRKMKIDKIKKDEFGFFSGDRIRMKLCPIIMKHIDAWHDIVSRQINLALILEDDSIFVPFFKEKFNRLIYTALRTGALRFNRTCLNETQVSIHDEEWFDQEPMFVIGICYDFMGSTFQRNQNDAQPILTTHKPNPTRCAHAYLITSCTAKAMIEMIGKHPTKTDTPDFLMNFIFPRSTVLQSFWLDPPLVYQGNRVIDMEHLETFVGSMYEKKL